MFQSRQKHSLANKAKNGTSQVRTMAVLAISIHTAANFDRHLSRLQNKSRHFVFQLLLEITRLPPTPTSMATTKLGENKTTHADTHSASSYQKANRIKSTCKQRPRTNENTTPIPHDSSPLSPQIDHIFLWGHQISDISVETKLGDSLEQVYCLMSTLARIVTDKLTSKAPRSWTKSIQVIKDGWNALCQAKRGPWLEIGRVPIVIWLTEGIL